MGVAGAPFPLYMSFIEPTSAFSLNYAVSALAMPVIGGTASWIGPVIGAVLLGTAQQIVTVTIRSELNVLVVGVLLVVFVVAAPHGILGLLRSFSGNIQRGATEDTEHTEKCNEFYTQHGGTEHRKVEQQTRRYGACRVETIRTAPQPPAFTDHLGFFLSELVFLSVFSVFSVAPC